MKRKLGTTLLLTAIILVALTNFITTILKFRLEINESWFSICISVMTLLLAFSLVLPCKRLSKWFALFLALLFAFKFVNDLGLPGFCKKNGFEVPGIRDLIVIFTLDIVTSLIMFAYFLGEFVSKRLLKLLCSVGLMIVIINLGWDIAAFSQNLYFILNDSIYFTMTLFFITAELANLLIFMLFLTLRCDKISLVKQTSV